jgi:cysteine-rich repeat protein
MPVSNPVAPRGPLAKWLVTLASGAMFAGLAVACSDGDSINTDGCTPGKQSSCACPGGTEGVQVCAEDGTSFGECDCGGTTSDCGNGALDAGEECDDGNAINDDGCTNACSLPTCGDGVVQEGEDCDDAGAVGGELDTCPSNCQNGGGTGGGGTGGGGTGGGGPTCATTVIFAGIVPENDATTGYTGVSQWTYNGMIKQAAGDAMCNAKALGSHLCDYEELVMAAAKSDADEPIMTNIANTTDIWVNRTTDALVAGVNSPPGAGGRCNDWTYITNHASDGEYAVFGMNGDLTFTLDNNTEYNVDSSTVQAGLQCGTESRAIPCCYPCNP